MAKKTTIFYAWQSDTPPKVNRRFIQLALKKALKNLKTDTNLEPALQKLAVSLDSDTQDVAGSPPVTETILRKITECSAFVADLTFVGATHDGLRSDGPRRLHPNPNVLLEYGYAVKCQGHNALIGVMNTAFGDPQEHDFPFDLRHLRWPIRYRLKDGSDPERGACLDRLSKELTIALRPILAKRAFRMKRLKFLALFGVIAFICSTILLAWFFPSKEVARRPVLQLLLETERARFLLPLTNNFLLDYWWTNQARRGLVMIPVLKGTESINVSFGITNTGSARAENVELWVTPDKALRATPNGLGWTTVPQDDGRVRYVWRIPREQPDLATYPGDAQVSTFLSFRPELNQPKIVTVHAKAGDSFRLMKADFLFYTSDNATSPWVQLPELGGDGWLTYRLTPNTPIGKATNVEEKK